jgi:hypothetical protein
MTSVDTRSPSGRPSVFFVANVIQFTFRATARRIIGILRREACRMKTRAFFAGLLVLSAGVGSSHAQSLQDFIADHQALAAAAKRCQMAINQHLQQMQYDAWHGRMTANQGPMCQNNMPRIISQMAYDEAQIYRMQPGNPRSSFCEITGVCRNPNFGPPSTGGGTTQADTDRIIRGDETTPMGNERPIGPDGPHHFDCGPGARDITAPSWMPPARGCVER